MLEEEEEVEKEKEEECSACGGTPKSSLAKGRRASPDSTGGVDGEGRM